MPLMLRVQETESETESIAEWLTSSNATQQNRASQALEAMDSKSATRYLVWLASLEEEKRWKQCQLFYKPCLFIAISLFGAYVISQIIAHIYHTEPVIDNITMSISFVFSLLNGYTRQPSTLEQAILTRLCADSDDPIVLPLLVNAMRSTPGPTLDIVIPGLMRLLPKVTPEITLSLAQWRFLLKYVSTSSMKTADKVRKVRLAEAILKGIKTAGCVELLPEVMRLKSQPPGHLRNKHVAEAANHCWEILRQQQNATSAT